MIVKLKANITAAQTIVRDCKNTENQCEVKKMLTNAIEKKFLRKIADALIEQKQTIKITLENYEAALLDEISSLFRSYTDIERLKRYINENEKVTIEIKATYEYQEYEEVKTPKGMSQLLPYFSNFKSEAMSIPQPEVKPQEETEYAKAYREKLKRLIALDNLKKKNF